MATVTVVVCQMDGWMDDMDAVVISDASKRACCSSDLSLRRRHHAASKAPLMQHMQIGPTGSDDVIALFLKLFVLK